MNSEWRWGGGEAGSIERTGPWDEEEGGKPSTNPHLSLLPDCGGNVTTRFTTLIAGTSP